MDKVTDARLSRIMVTDSCWLWMGATTRGYGVVGGGRTGTLEYAHRWSYRYFVGPIPIGTFILHDCDVRNCVNPDHLHLGNDSMNIREAYARGRNRGAKKLTDIQAEAIRGDSRLQRTIATEYGVSQATVSNIKAGKTYRVSHDPSSDDLIDNESVDAVPLSAPEHFLLRVPCRLARHHLVPAPPLLENEHLARE